MKTPNNANSPSKQQDKHHLTARKWLLTPSTWKSNFYSVIIKMAHCSKHLVCLMVVGVFCIFPTQVFAANDILQQTLITYLDWIDGLSSPHFWLPIRLAFALVLATIVCSLIHRYMSGVGSVSGRIILGWGFFLLSLAAVTAFPFEQIPMTRSSKAFDFTVALIGIIAVPPALSCFLAQIEISRRRAIRVVYLLLAILLIINSIR
jgi:hypothetical protein